MQHKAGSAERHGAYRSAVHQGLVSESLPGAELVECGLRDLGDGVASMEALLVSIGAPRLRGLGLSVARSIPDPEQRLYRLLSERHGDAAHSPYNALV
jgi:hypothetical protein